MRRLIFVIFILAFLITGCEQRAVTLHKQDSFQFKNSKIELTKKVRSLDITVDSGKLQVYCWDMPFISCELKQTVRDNKTEDELEKLLDKFSVETEIKDNTCFISVNYNKRIDNPDDILSEIKLTIPRRINQIKLEQDQGSFIVEDKFQGSITANIRKGNTELKALYGNVNLNCTKGNFRLGSGKLTGSNIKIESGNISLKAECQNKSDYIFETETGNIELCFPVQSDICIDAFGTVSHNQFTGVDGGTTIKASTKIGKISVNGY